LDVNHNTGRLVVTEKVKYLTGSCLLVLRLNTSKLFKFAEELSGNMIQVIFHKDGRVIDRAISYIHAPERFVKESFTQDQNWKNIKRKQKAYTTLPQLIEKFEKDEMIINIPFELTESLEEIEMDINLCTFITPSQTASPENPENCFALHKDIDTIGYSPYNLQSTNTYISHAIEEMEDRERLEIREEISEKLQWSLQEQMEQKPLIEDVLLNEKPQDHRESLTCFDDSQIFMDYVTLRIPVTVTTFENTSKEERHLKHQFTLPIYGSPPAFVPHKNKHHYIPTTNNV